MNGGHIKVNGWIRPISTAHVEIKGRSEGGQVTDVEMLKALNRKSVPQLLEIIEMKFSGPCATDEQPENWALDLAQGWKSKGAFPWKHIDLLADNPGHLWDTSGKGWNRVTAGYHNRSDFQSLYCIKTTSVIEAKVGSRPRVSGSKEMKLYRTLLLPHRSIVHQFSISDPEFENRYSPYYPSLGEQGKTFPIPAGALITVSLTPAVSFAGEPPCHYKMAAGIIMPPAV